MPTTNEPFHVQVQVLDRDKAETVRALLDAVQPGTAQVFDGAVEGWATNELVKTLRTEHRLHVERVADDPTPASEAGGAAPDAAPGADYNSEAAPPAPLRRRTKRNDPDLKRVFNEFVASANKVRVAPRGFEMVPAPDATTPQPQPNAPQPGEDVYRVRLRGAMRPEWRKEFEKRGLEVCSYRGGTYQMFLTPEQAAELAKLPFVQEVKPYNLLDTVTTDFLIARERDETAPPPPALAADGGPPSSTYDVLMHRASDTEEVRRLLEGTPGVKVLDWAPGAIRFAAPTDSPILAGLADLSQVKTIAHYEPPKLMVNFARGDVGLDAVAVDVQGAPRWTGKGEVIGVCDSGIDKTHPDLADRVLASVSFRNCPTDDVIGHGTHVAGIIAGTGKASIGKPHPPVMGAAPEAKLVVVGIVDPTNEQPQLPLDLGVLLKEATARGATIINLSLSTPLGGTYDLGSASIDKFVHENPDVLVVVAAGNDGAAPQGKYVFNNIGTPASAKNVLTVGASGSSRNGINGAGGQPLTWGEFRPAVFPLPAASAALVAGVPDVPAGISSRGPTDNESVKPDVIAPGTFILAAKAAQFRPAPGRPWRDFPENPKYVYLGGTSMAAPLVAGAAAVVRQYLREQENVASPSAALLKAVLLASAKRLPSLLGANDAIVGYPDFDQGFGRIDLREVLPHAGAPPGRKLLLVNIPNNSPLALESRMPIGAPRRSFRRYRFQVPANAATELRVVLTWTDAPGNGLQNTLTLTLTRPDGTPVLGNPDQIFRREPMFENTTPFDKKNNAQQIRLKTPEAGDYTISVVAQNTVAPPQGYALCVCGPVAGNLTEENI